jgi:hypothetical protein
MLNKISILFPNLGRDYIITYKTTKDPNPSIELFSYGERVYDHFINFAQKKGTLPLTLVFNLLFFLLTL